MEAEKTFIGSGQWGAKQFRRYITTALKMPGQKSANAKQIKKILKKKEPQKIFSCCKKNTSNVKICLGMEQGNR